MADITAEMVKNLRERTGAGMMECKKALVEAKGDMAAAEDIIAKSGNKKADKSASRTAAQGRISIANSHTSAVMIEINCETDFVARDNGFIQFCQAVADLALAKECQSVDTLLSLPFDSTGSVEEARKAAIVRIGENIQIRRLHFVKAQAMQRIGSYIHNARIGTLVLLEGGNEELAKDLAMHIAAMKPQYISSTEIPAAIIEKEHAIFMERAKQSGKPDNILEKIVQGQLQKQANEICLLGQPFFKDPDKTIESLLKSLNAKVLAMLRFEVGEGIEVVKKSFEEEVMEQARGSKA
ncbi:MAG: translation elongation factor Ts [Candidatus Berkiella sp.]